MLLPLSLFFKYLPFSLLLRFHDLFFLFQKLFILFFFSSQTLFFAFLQLRQLTLLIFCLFLVFYLLGCPLEIRVEVWAYRSVLAHDLINVCCLGLWRWSKRWTLRRHLQGPIFLSLRLCNGWFLEWFGLLVCSCIRDYVNELIILNIQSVVILVTLFHWMTWFYLKSIHVLVCIIWEYLFSSLLIRPICLTWLYRSMRLLLHRVERILAQWFPRRLTMLQSLSGFIALLGWYASLFLGSFDCTTSCFDSLSRWLPALSVCLPRATRNSRASWSSSSPYSLLIFHYSRLFLFRFLLRTEHQLQFIIDFEQIRYTLHIIFIDYYLLRITINSRWIQGSFWPTLLLILW